MPYWILPSLFLPQKKVSARILSTFKRLVSKKMGKTPSSHIIHSLGGEYCWIVRDSKPIRLFKSPRSLSVYILMLYIQLFVWSGSQQWTPDEGVKHSDGQAKFSLFVSLQNRKKSDGNVSYKNFKNNNMIFQQLSL